MSASIEVFRAAGTALVVAFRETGLPEVLHWGRDPGDVPASASAAIDLAVTRQVSASALDEPWPLTILPTERDGWQGRPAVSGSIAGDPILPSWRVESVDRDDRGFSLRATADGLTLTSALRFDEAGVLRVDHRLENAGEVVVDLAVLEAVLPLAADATELLDLSGRWTRERSPQRRPIVQGANVRESRRGRTGHDSPTLLVAGTAGFSDRAGELWAVHLGWSGDSVHRIDRLPEGRSTIGVGELLRHGEIALAAGETFAAPTAHFVWSERGLDGLSDRLHRSLRARPGHPSTPRPVVLNTWEAVYFDHDVETLIRLADTAASIGVERFVLDDGWFLGRRNDRAGLGDWTVDGAVWPDGLHPLVEHVRSTGMQFGLWVEPEMVNPDSDLAREHPDWILGPAAHAPRTWRTQQVLDLAHPAAASFVLESLSSLVSEYGIDYLKWDHNRDLLEAVHDARAGVDAQTRAAYALLDELRRRHPGVEIESCSSGGARVDLGVLERTDRVWASDTNDPVERLRIQRWTELLLPPELIGSHVGPERSHTTGRATDLRFRMAATLFASPGIECDISGCDPDELVGMTGWIAEYKRLRSLLHTGTLVHGETRDEGSELTGVVSADADRAVFRLARSTTGEWAVPPAIRPPGLDRARDYRVRVLDAFGPARVLDMTPPPWLAAARSTDGLILSGGLLREIGLRAPLLPPASALVLEFEAVRAAAARAVVPAAAVAVPVDEALGDENAAAPGSLA